MIKRAEYNEAFKLTPDEFIRLCEASLTTQNTTALNFKVVQSKG